MPVTRPVSHPRPRQKVLPGVQQIIDDTSAERLVLHPGAKPMTGCRTPVSAQCYGLLVLYTGTATYFSLVFP